MNLEMFSLQGKVAIVTGAGTGLGQGMAAALAGAGSAIAAVDCISLSETETVVRELGRRFLPIEADLSTIAPLEEIVSKVEQEFGRLDILVNNAGIIRREDSIEFGEQDWDDVLNINLKTVFFFSQAAARQFLKQGSPGKIINVASLLAYQGGVRVPSYTASKSGVMGLTRLLACEWAGHGINVNAIAPGYMATNNTKPLRDDPVRSAEILGRIPAGRWGLPEDLAGPAVFLASSASDYVNGYTVAVDGGWLAR